MNPATTIAIDVNHNGSQGRVDLIFGEWKDSHIEITFRDRLYRNSGVIRFNGESAGIMVPTSRPFWFPGHITLRPLRWWEKQWQSRFRLVSTSSRFASQPVVYSNGGLYNQQWTLWERC